MFRQASSREWRVIVASALAQAGVASWEYDLTTGELWWSENAGPLFGRPEGFIPAGFDEAIALMDPGDDRPSDIGQIVAALEPGPVEVERRAVLPDGSTRWTQNTYFLMRDASGEPVRLAGMMSDIQDRKRREQEDELLHHANQVLMGSVEWSSTLQATADLLVPGLADWCVIDLLRDGVLEPVARAHIDVEKLRWAEAIQAEYPPDMDAALGAPNVARTGVSELYVEVPDELLVSVAEGDERLLEILRAVGYRSVIVVPLRGRRAVIGTMTLVMADSGRSYDEAALRFAERVGGQIGVALENAELHAQLSEALDRETAAVHTLQKGLAPDPLPDLDELELAAHYEIGGSNNVGGDWYDVFMRREGSICIVIGDVVGRGIPAVASMSRYRNSLRTLLMEDHSPGRALTILNGIHDRHATGEGFATVQCIAYEPSARTLTWSSAGHPPALLRDSAGHVSRLWREPQPPLDVAPGFEYEEGIVEAEPGGLLVLYTDGLIERRGESIDVSVRRLVEALESAPDSPKAVVDQLLERLPTNPSEDDLAVLVARFPRSANG
jgi:serine phosphatase RsbU (regulator of sigma subunit)